MTTASLDDLYGRGSESYDIILTTKDQPKYNPQVMRIILNYGNIFDDDALRGNFDGITFWDIKSTGVAYRCLIPKIEHMLEDEVKENMDESPALYLKDMEFENCFYMNNGWWTYEFCYKKHIKQFHQTQEGLTETVYFLGQYDKKNDLINTVKDGHYSEYYNQGTPCDLTKKPRTSEIRYICSNTNARIVSIMEPTVCSYVVIIETPLLCNHPRYKLPPQKLDKIVCFEKPVPTLEELEALGVKTFSETTKSAKKPASVPKETILPAVEIKAEKIKDSMMDIIQEALGVALDIEDISIISDSEDLKDILKMLQSDEDPDTENGEISQQKTAGGIHIIKRGENQNQEMMKAIEHLLLNSLDEHPTDPSTNENEEESDESQL
jgi:hypothetical protein